MMIMIMIKLGILFTRVDTAQALTRIENVIFWTYGVSGDRYRKTISSCHSAYMAYQR